MIAQSSTTVLKAKTISGLSWSAATQAGNQLFKFAVSIVLARILTPAEFGIAAMLYVFTGFASLFTSLGLGASLVQKQTLRAEHLDTVFWVNAATGALLSLIFAASAPLIALFYHEPTLSTITPIVAMSFFISSLNVVQSALLQKSMDFRRLFWIEISSIAAGGVVAVILARSGFGIWSLIVQALLTVCVNVALMWVSSSWKPKFRFDASALRELFGFSGNLLASNAINYWSRNFDTLLVGKVLGSVTAGIYNRAYQLMMLPMTQMMTVMTRVMFPALAVIQDDKRKVRSVYLRSTRIISLVAFPLMSLLLVLGEPTILLLYGEKWRAAIPIFQILCIAAIAQSVGNSVSWIYTSQGRTDIQLKWGIIGTAIRILAFIIGIRWGVIGMTVSYVVSGYFITWYPSWSIPGKLIGLRFSEMVANLAPTFYCAALASLTVWLIDSLVLHPASNWIRVAAGFATGGSIYFAGLLVFRVPAWRDVVHLLNDGQIPAFRKVRPLMKFVPGWDFRQDLPMKRHAD